MLVVEPPAIGRLFMSDARRFWNGGDGPWRGEAESHQPHGFLKSARRTGTSRAIDDGAEGGSYGGGVGLSRLVSAYADILRISRDQQLRCRLMSPRVA